jgi:hypothetical protein
MDKNPLIIKELLVSYISGFRSTKVISVEMIETLRKQTAEDVEVLFFNLPFLETKPTTFLTLCGVFRLVNSRLDC